MKGLKMSQNYNNKILLEMLDTSIRTQIENEICSDCKILHDKDHRCKNFDHCFDLIFQGLQDKAEKAIGKTLYIQADQDDDKMPEDEVFDPEVMSEMYSEQA